MKEFKNRKQYQSFCKVLSSNVWIGAILLCIAKETVCTPKPAKRSNVFVPGIHEEEVEAPVVYNSYVPVILEFKQPNLDEVDIIGREAGNCANSTTHAGITCPAAYYLNPIMKTETKNLYPDPVASIYLGTEQENSSSQEATESLVDSFSCHQISSHFKTFTSVLMNVDNYILYLMNTCSFQRETLIHKVLTASTLPITNPLFNETFHSFKASFTDHIKWVDNLTAQALETNFYATMRGMYLTNLAIEKNRWDSAISSCSRNTLPATLVDQSTLKKILAEVVRMILPLDYKLSFPEEDLYSLYKAKLTDCTFTDKNSYVVRLLVPVKQSNTDLFTLYRLNSVPSFYKASLGYKMCELSSIPEMLAYKFTPGPGSGIMETVLRVNCQDQDSLCFIPLRKDGNNEDYPRSDYPFFCAQALMTNTHEEVISKFCKAQIQCTSFPLDEAAYIRKISSNSVYYRNLNYYTSSQVNISVICSGTVVDVLSLNSSITDLLISIGCDCHVKQDSQVIFTAGRPCTSISTSSTLHLRKLTLSDDVLEPRIVLPNITMNLLDKLSERMGVMESELQKATEKSLSLLNNRSSLVILVVILSIIIFFLGIWVFQLWRWKRENLFRRSNYNPVFDQSSLIQEDATL